MNKFRLWLPVLLMLALILALPVTAAQDSNAMTVYVDQANGADTNNGLTEATAVQTMNEAYSLLNNGLSADGTGTIVLVSDYTHSFGEANQYIADSAFSHSYRVVLRGKSADTKFLLANGAKQSYLHMIGPTTLEQLCIYLTGSNKYVSIHGAGVNGSLIIGQGVSNGDDATKRPSLAAIPNKSTASNTANAEKSVYLEINSGDWKSVYATAYTTNSYGNATLVLNGGTVNKLSTRYKNTHTGTVRFELNGGVVKTFCPIGADAAAVVNGDITVVRAGADVPEKTKLGHHNGTLNEETVATAGALILTTKSDKYTVTLETGLKTGTKVEPTKIEVVDGVEKNVYEGLTAGTYRYKVSRSGYYTINKVLYYTAEMAAERIELDVSTSIRAFSGSTDLKYQSIAVNEFSAGMMEMLKGKESDGWWSYKQYLTTPVFAEGKAAHQATTQEEMESYIAGLDDANDHMYVYSIGKAADGKDIPVVIFSLTDLSGAQTLEEAAALIRANEKLTVHYQAQIHGNEPAGGEAALATIGRLDTAEYGDRLLEKMNIYVIPRLNPEGSQAYIRVVPSTKLNGNRDYLMARTVEIQAQHYVYNLFMPEVAIDGHEYTVELANNNMAYKDMMMAGGYNGNSGAEFAKFTEDMILMVIPQLQENGLDFSFYTNIANNNYSASGAMYAGLRGSVSFLLESRGIGFGNFTMDRRVISHLITLDTILEYAYTNTEDVQTASDAERQRIINNGLTYEDSDVLVLAHKKVSDERLAHTNHKYSYLTGEKTGTIDVVPTKHVADTTRVRPTAYVIPAQQEWTQEVLELLDLHAISYEFYEAGTTINLQQYLGTTAGATLSEEQAVVFVKGAYVITMNQPSALILTSLMEPDLQNEYFEEKDSGNTNIYGNFAQLQIIPNEGTGFPIYRYIRDLNAEGKIDTTEPEYKVYVHSKNGLDTNDAYSEAAAAKTIEHAFAQLSSLMALAPEGTEGTVVFLDLYTVGSNSAAYTFPSHDYPVILTSKTGNEGIVKGGTDTKYRWFAFGGDTTLDNITIQPATNSTYYYLFANGHKLVVENTVKTPSFAGANNHFNISAGRYSGTHTGNADLTILGGTWQHLYMGGYTGSLKGDCNIVINHAEFTGIVQNSYNGTTTGNITIRLDNTQFGSNSVFYAGNANSKDVNGNVTLILGENVNLTEIYTGSRDAGNVTGAVTVVQDGADLSGITIHRGAKNAAGTVGKNVFAYKSGKVEPIVGYDEVQVYVDGAFHSLSAAMTKLSLKPSVTGFGYKAEFTADDAIKEMLVSQGYSIWLDGYGAINRTVSDFRNSLTLRLQNFDIENFGSTKVHAKVFVELTNGLIVETEVVSYSMQDMVEMISADLSKYNAQQIQAVQTMLEGYQAPQSWNISNLLAWTPNTEE